MNVSLLEAWRLWLSGEPLAGMDLWGLSITWWGRIGKILEFVAAYGVIVEIAGPTRLRKYGESLRDLVPRRTIDATLQSTRAWAWANLRFLFSRPGSEKEKRALQESMSHSRIDNINYLTALILIIPIIIWLVREILPLLVIERFSLPVIWAVRVVGLVVIAGFLYAIFLLVISPVLTYAFLGFVNMVGAAADTVFFRGMANVLEYKSLDSLVKVGSLLILAVGFQFDLLAS